MGWLLALTLISVLSVHAIDITNEFLDEDADAVVIEAYREDEGSARRGRQFSFSTGQYQGYPARSQSSLQNSIRKFSLVPEFVPMAMGRSRCTISSSRRWSLGWRFSRNGRRTRARRTMATTSSTRRMATTSSSTRRMATTHTATSTNTPTIYNTSTYSSPMDTANKHSSPMDTANNHSSPMDTANNHHYPDSTMAATNTSSPSCR